LIVWGGWDGHQPKEVGELFRRVLSEEGFQVEVSDSLDAFNEEARLSQLDLIVPVWTCGNLKPEQQAALCGAVRKGGVGIAGCHGGMGDAFRNNCEYQFMTGGQWVAHPGNDTVRYTVNIRSSASPITTGITDFEVTSEQYYMHVDPAIEVLATTTFTGEHAPWIDGVVMPVVWKKSYGAGRVFYSSLGHRAYELDVPEIRTLMTRGMLWAARE